MKKQDPRECKHYYYNTGGGWTHWCVLKQTPCLICDCTDFTPKTTNNEETI